DFRVPGPMTGWGDSGGSFEALAPIEHEPESVVGSDIPGQSFEAFAPIEPGHDAESEAPEARSGSVEPAAPPPPEASSPRIETDSDMEVVAHQADPTDPTEPKAAPEPGR